MERNLLQELKVGAFVLSFVFLVVAAAFVLGGGTEAFSARYTLHARYVDVKGLKPGAVVRLAGIDVGEVKIVELASNRSDGKNVHVELSIREEYHDKIRTDSVAGISNVGVLGDNIITVTVGGDDAQPIPANGEIASAEALDFVDYADRATAIVDNTASVSHKFDLMLGSEEEAKAAKIADSLAHVEAMLGEAKQGKGVLNVLIYDQAAGRRVKDILASADALVADVADMTQEVRTGDGLAHELIYGHGGEDLADRLAAFTGEATGLVSDIKTKPSLMHSLLYEPENARIVDELKGTMAGVNATVASVNAGEGSLGLLVKDPQLYEDLRALFGGAQRNALLRAYVRSTMAHAQEEDGGAWVAPVGDPSRGGK
jgi:phospholipid/cholesterol/gamma-HCH transport system substrate-binding protein